MHGATDAPLSTPRSAHVSRSAMWAIGRYEINRRPAMLPTAARSTTASTVAHTLAWLMATALGGPVVPDV